MRELLDESLSYFTFHLAKAVSVIFERDSYLYWPYIVSSTAIAAIAWWWLAPPPGRPTCEAFLEKYFSQKVWLHRSAREDYWLYLANAVSLPVVFALLLVDARDIISTFNTALGIEQNAAIGEATVGSRILYTLLFFVAYDLGRFVMHCLLHDVPVLWQFHKVHHSAEVLTPMTSFRAHPLELLIMGWGPVLTTAVFTIAFNAICTAPVSFYSFLGVHVLLFVSNLIGNLRHSPVWISYGPVVGRWLISPAHHQLHHSCEARHIGCNRGFELAVWDRLYGTLYVPGTEPEQFRLGLGDTGESRYRNVAAMYFLPFLAAAREAGSAVRRCLTRLPAR